MAIGLSAGREPPPGRYTCRVAANWHGGV